MTHVAIKATVEWRLLLGTTEGWLNNTTTWSSISCDRHRADHVTKITVRPDLLLHLPSPVLEGEVCAAAGVCDNEVSFERMTISSCSQSGACSLAVVALFWNLSVLGVLEVHTSLARPALWYLCYIYWQAAERNSGCPLTVGLSALRRLRGLLVVFLPKISPRQRPERSRPRCPSLSHSLSGEGRYRWR